jgi:hypothetical protein
MYPYKYPHLFVSHAVPLYLFFGGRSKMAKGWRKNTTIYCEQVLSKFRPTSVAFSIVRNFGWEAWTRTRIARFRVWSPTNWTTSQKLKTKQLIVELHDLWAEDPNLSLLDPLKQISHREPTPYRELSIQSTRGRVFHQPLRPRAVEARWNG